MVRAPSSIYESAPPDEYRGQTMTVLGRSGLRVSRAAFGVMTFGSQTDEPTAKRMVDACLDAGVQFFDTANVYNKGASEEILGRALGSRRGEVVLASKVRYPMSDNPNHAGLTRTHVLEACEASLRRLGTESLDLYYLHAPDVATPIEETLAALDTLARQGKIRAVGLSNFASWQACEALWKAEVMGTIAPTVVQCMYNVLTRVVEYEMMPFCAAHGVATCVYNPLAAGLLSGKHSRDGSTQAGTRFDANAMYQDRFWQPAYFDALDALKTIADQAGIGLVELALRWLLDRPGTDVVLLGASRMEHLTANLEAMAKGPLPADVSDATDAAWRSVEAICPKYNR